MPVIDLPTAARVANMPPQTRRRTPKNDWYTIVDRLRARPGVWIMVNEHASSGIFSYLRQGKCRAFWGMGGKLHLTMRNQVSGMGNLWLMWTPEGWTDLDQQRVDDALASGEGIL